MRIFNQSLLDHRNTQLTDAEDILLSRSLQEYMAIFIHAINIVYNLGVYQ